jgi:hypothetical protein
MQQRSKNTLIRILRGIAGDMLRGKKIALPAEAAPSSPGGKFCSSFLPFELRLRLVLMGKPCIRSYIKGGGAQAPPP